MGEIWFGRDTRLDREVAVKIVRFPSGVPDEAFIKRFVRESRVMAGLSHPGVPAVYDVGMHEERPYLVMQRIRGISLKDLIAEQGPLPIGWVAGIGAQICAVLAAAHEASLVHRDLKPSNVMLDTEGAVKVIDFGLATGPNLADFSRITASGEPLGTPAYMAPEQVMAAMSTPQTDLYALGCTLHEALSGRPVFVGTTSYSLMSQQVSEPPGPLRSLRPDVPAELERLVLHLLEKKPEDRPASAQAVYERLLPFVVSLGPLPGAVKPLTKSSPTRMYARVLSRVFADPAPPSAASVPPATGQALSTKVAPSPAVSA
ncbi:MAG: serine/threonine protein kinase, partial [Micromonosporaceae bacterium]|nr:serine/threonine protein kinase [Micromonosporaceae bacterium]